MRRYKMKIHRVVQMLGATTTSGKLASDMYDLNYKTYYSKAEGRDIPISHMDFQHMVRAFVKQNAEDVKVATRKANDVVARESYQVMWDNCKELEKQVKNYKKLAEDNFISSVNDDETSELQEKIYKKNLQEQEDKLLGLTTKVENLQGMLKERDELLEQAESLAHKESKHVEYWRKLYYNCESTKGHYYTFTEVPQDEEGKEFVKNCRKYLNRESYKIRVKGQHLKKELYGQGKASYGQSIEDSTHLRVYIDAI